MPEIKPRHRLVELPKHIDARGSLIFGQESDHIPFAVKRFFVIYDLTGTRRGGHAHRQQHQFLTMPSGGVTVTVDNGRNRVPIRLEQPNLGLHVPPGLWLDLEDFTAGAICLVLASGPYAEADYIRDREEFMHIAKTHPAKH